MEKINWFWAHRRNSSLHHMSLIARGFHSRGFLPVVDFHFHNQIFVGKPGRGVYIFYDRDELNKKYKDVQRSIERNKNFAKDFKARSDQLFADLFAVCKKIKETDLSTASNEGICQLLVEFKEKITAGPLITVQLWGIEACWDEEYSLSKEISSKVSDKEFPVIKGRLSQSTGKSVALSEKESFLKVCMEIEKIPGVLKKFKEGTADEISRILEVYPGINSSIQEHIKNFEWVNSEYVSEKWDFQRWMQMIKNELNDDVKSRLQKIHEQYTNALGEKQEIIVNLKLSDSARHVIIALNEFVSERDWAKGKFCYALSIYDLLLEEIAKRLYVSKGDILHMEAEELLDALKTMQAISVEERKNGFALVSKNGDMNIVGSEELEMFIANEEIEKNFSPVTRVRSFKGVVASRGKVKGRVRVIDDPERMSEFKDGEILVTYMTTMEFTPLFGKAAGIITDEGGLSSHAAIISREFGLPCIVGTTIATRNLRTGDIIELNASEGKITILDEEEDTFI
ncbi:hypothetical protein J4460_08105 [Candidatus Woesearchaeota archaeon]|nr:MAG: pyruvate, water dikinase [archaeon GW2011_AR4]MBS3130602.1 hypothetical protein [Candidatus Woesearchaeota archaeon]HIH39056.1 hypothetical protein [Candidatus Woesearchaeota archaeon]HIH48261.1 hypothetical protein [Candidatus Woesearchaeota archaeon]